MRVTQPQPLPEHTDTRHGGGRRTGSGNRPGHIELRHAAFDSVDAAVLLTGADAYNESLYGHADESPIDPREFDAERGGTFLIAYLAGQPVGCGGLRSAESPAPSGAAEVKRMFVTEQARGHGIGRTILNALEDAARAMGYPRVVLDVGSKQDAAHALYESNGYERIPGFTIYRDKPGNRAYGKDLN